MKLVQNDAQRLVLHDRPHILQYAGVAAALPLPLQAWRQDAALWLIALCLTVVAAAGWIVMQRATLVLDRQTGRGRLTQTARRPRDFALADVRGVAVGTLADVDGVGRRAMLILPDGPLPLTRFHRSGEGPADTVRLLAEWLGLTPP